ncbi:hypothetical protein VIGAN_06025600 [Vigna angularis var. angularis]|uniref:Uncharacterized protein n=1 Tax=Vigna angularis var. angularis TaxID=157739 RepID=A0A0S3S934_PHAAN|nr:hypothetical protein VIGAN_06025600 [Vigna angularis var. angularis]
MLWTYCVPLLYSSRISASFSVPLSPYHFVFLQLKVPKSKQRALRLCCPCVFSASLFQYCQIPWTVVPTLQAAIRLCFLCCACWMHPFWGVVFSI